MGVRFRKSFKIIPGVRVNVGKKGLSSINIGPRGASVSIGKQGTYSNFSVGGGTGLSFRQKISDNKKIINQEKRSNVPLLAFILLLLIFTLPLFSHGGRTNSEGCHNQRGGSYHCHNKKPKVYKKKTKRNYAKNNNSKDPFNCQKNYCKYMTSCKEAYYKLNKCGHTRLDGDRDGVPCENICAS